MTKKELVDTVAEKLNITCNSAENAVLTTIATITLGLAESGSVKIPNFGTFKVKEHSAHIGRNPRTGETIQIRSKKRVVFKPSKVTIKTIN